MSPVPVEMPSGTVVFQTLILDFTGTLSVDGALLPGVAERLQDLAPELRILVLTADTFGTAREALRDLPVEVQVIRDGHHKAEVVATLEPGGRTIGVGNGRNDVPMMRTVGLGIAVLGPEGAAAELLAATDVVVSDIRDALDLIRHPVRLKATLRD